MGQFPLAVGPVQTRDAAEASPVAHALRIQPLGDRLAPRGGIVPGRFKQSALLLRRAPGYLNWDGEQ